MTRSLFLSVNGKSLVLCGFLLAGCGRSIVRQPELLDVSGVVRQGGSLLLVDDESPSAYFRLPLSIFRDAGSIKRALLEEVKWDQEDLAIDLESIEILADGRVVVLSERLRAFVGEDGVIAQYEAPFSEIGKRGLEGLAVRPAADNSSLIALLWEGGYPVETELSTEVRALLSGNSFRPQIAIQRLASGASRLRVQIADLDAIIPLKVRLPKGSEPEAQRFRAPDLVWLPIASNNQSEQQDGFVVLLSFENAVEPRTYQHHWLQRFALTGDPVGSPVDLDVVLPEDLQGLNWEGLSWFEDGASLVVVCETSPKGFPVAALVPAPSDWNLSNRMGEDQ